MCKCRRSTEDRKVKCSLETAFEYKKFDRLNAKNKTVHIGKWQAFRRDNGRLDWRPVTMSTPCGNIGRAVSHCPKLRALGKIPILKIEKKQIIKQTTMLGPNNEPLHFWDFRHK